MELRHLKYFVAVAEELHFSRAAERVGIAQPPFSQQIKMLEEEIGVPLLLRTKRTVELTAAGQAFLVEARKILAQAEHSVNLARRAARGEIGQLVVGFVSSIVYGKFSPVFGLMRTRHPNVALVLRDLTSEEQVKEMKAGQLDVGLVRPPLPHAAELALRVVGREPLMMAIPAAHRLAKQKSLKLNAFADESFLLVPRYLGPGFYDQVMALCARAGFVPNVVQEARTAQTIVSLVAGGMGVSIVPASMQTFQPDGIVYRSIEPETAADLAVMWRPDDKSPVLNSFLEIVWEVAKLKAPSKVAK